MNLLIFAWSCCDQWSPCPERGRERDERSLERWKENAEETAREREGTLSYWPLRHYSLIHYYVLVFPVACLYFFSVISVASDSKLIHSSCIHQLFTGVLLFYIFFTYSIFNKIRGQITMRKRGSLRQNHPVRCHSLYTRLSVNYCYISRVH